MNKANECTCPSGDGSLVHPCPAHPAVEQAGGDERAAFEQWEAEQIAFVLRQIGSMDADDIDGDNVDLRFEDASGRDTGCDVSIVDYAEKAANLIEAMLSDRAALAQPSPKSGDYSDQSWINAGCPPEQPEQAEAERPEVVAVVRAQGFGRVCEAIDVDTLYQHCSEGEPLMTVAQHERIVGALRAKADQLREALEWRKENQAGQRELLRSVTAERDAALARVAELETALEPFAAVADAYDDSEDDDHEPYTDMGCDDRLRLTLGQHRAGRIALEGRTPQAQAQHSGPAYVSYTTQPAESLAGIALRHLKDESRWVEIHDINAHAFPDMRSHSYYPAGTVIKLPAAAPGKEGV